jgi:surface polysaccharide O-acyltransferase-like enzyme
MVAARNKDKILSFARSWRFVLFVTTLILGVYVFAEGLINFINTKNYLTFYSNFRPSTLIYTIFLALILFFLFDKQHLKASPRKKLSDASFFIFFIHVIVLENVWSLFGKYAFDSVRNTLIGKIFFDPIFFGVVLGISFLIAFVIRKIPYASKITG